MRGWKLFCFVCDELSGAARLTTAGAVRILVTLTSSISAFRKPVVVLLAEKFSNIHEDRTSIPVFTGFRHWSYPEPDESNPHPHISFFRQTLELCHYQRLGLASSLFPSVFSLISYLHFLSVLKRQSCFTQIGCNAASGKRDRVLSFKYIIFFQFAAVPFGKCLKTFRLNVLPRPSA